MRKPFSARKCVDQRRCDVAMVADDVRPSMPGMGELAPQLDVALATDVDQDVESRDARRDCARIWSRVVDTIAQEDYARVLLAHPTELVAGQLEWERHIRQPLGGQPQQVVNQRQRGPFVT